MKFFEVCGAEDESDFENSQDVVDYMVKMKKESELKIIIYFYC